MSEIDFADQTINQDTQVGSKMYVSREEFEVAQAEAAQWHREQGIPVPPPHQICPRMTLVILSSKENRELRGATAHMVYMWLQTYVGTDPDQPNFRVTNETQTNMAFAFKKSRSRVSEAVKELVKLGLIVRAKFDGEIRYLLPPPPSIVESGMPDWIEETVQT